jgi:hypothetical protein
MIGGSDGDDRGSTDIGGTSVAGSCAVVGRVWELSDELADIGSVGVVNRAADYLRAGSDDCGADALFGEPDDRRRTAVGDRCVDVAFGRLRRLCRSSQEGLRAVG